MRSVRIILLCALPLMAQTDKGKQASIEGVVTNSVTGAPVPRAHVHLQAEDQHSAITGADGRFSIAGIGAGPYWAAAERVGFASAINIPLKTGDDKSDIEIKLVPTGAIAGRVTDADGEPAQGISVAAQGAGNGEYAETDEKGQFRIGGLAPGKYRVHASLPGDMMGGRPEIRTDGTAEVHYAATYYPGVLTEKEVGTVTVQPGGEAAGVEIRLLSVPFVRVSGKVVGVQPGAEDVNIMVWRHNSGSGIGIKKDGTFELWRLSPGKYWISANWKTPLGEEAHAAGKEIEVAGANIDNIELRAIPPSTISGTLEFEDDRAQQVVQKLLPGPLIQCWPIVGEPMWDNIGPGTVGADATFRLQKVAAGKYRISLSAEGVYVKSMRLGSTTIDGSVLDLSNGSNGADLSLLVSANMGSISGKAAGAVVHVFDAEQENGSRQQIPVKPDGTYRIDNLRPGTYKLIATESGDIAQSYDDSAEIVELEAGAKVTKDLKRQTPSSQ
jgi:Carboxypeptidase regulatory-like domain